MYAYATCETVNKSSKSKNICYIDSNPNICFICKNENKRSFFRIRYNVMTRHRLGAHAPDLCLYLFYDVRETV